MVYACAVNGCVNRCQKGTARSFHMFPFSDPERLQKWISLVFRQDTSGKPWKPTKASRICSDHFLPGDFGLDTQRNFLRSTAVPSVFPSHPPHKQPMRKTSRRSPKKRPFEVMKTPKNNSDQEKEQRCGYIAAPETHKDSNLSSSVDLRAVQVGFDMDHTAAAALDIIDFLATFHQANGDLISNQHGQRQQTKHYSQHAQVTSPAQMDIRGPSSFNHMQGVQQGSNINYNSLDGHQSQIYRSQQQYQPDQFYPTQCTPSNYYHQKQQYAHNGPMPSSTQSVVSPQQSPQQSSMHRMHPPNSKPSPMQKVHLSSSQIPSAQGAPSQIPHMYNSSQHSPQQPNGTVAHHPLFNAAPINPNSQFRSNHCSHRNDPPLGNMHTIQSNSSSIEDAMQFVSPTLVKPARYPPSETVPGNRRNGNVQNTYNAKLVEEQRIRNRLASTSNQVQSNSYAPPHHPLEQSPQRRTMSPTVSRFQQYGNVHSNTQGPQQPGQPTMENIYGSHPPPNPQNPPAYPHHPPMLNVPRNPVPSANIHNKLRTTQAVSQSPTRGLPSYPVNVNNSSLGSTGCLPNSSRAQETVRKNTETSTNLFAVFSIPPFSVNSGSVRGGVRGRRGAGGYNRGRGRGGGISQGDVHAISHVQEMSEKNDSHLQWSRPSQPVVAPSFQSDIEAMQADLSPYTASTDTRRPPIQNTTITPNTQMQQSKGQPPPAHQARRHSQSEASQPSQSSAAQQSHNAKTSKASALAAIQIKQEMAENLSKAKSANVIQATSNVGVTSTNTPSVSQTQDVAKKSATPNRATVNAHCPAVTEARESNKTASHTVSDATPLHKSEKRRIEVSVRDKSPTLSLPKETMQNANRPVNNHLKIVVTQDKEYLPCSTSDDRAQQERSRPAAMPSSDYSSQNKKPIAQRQRVIADKIGMSARDKVFDMWKAGQVVGRSPARGRGRGRGSISSSRVAQILKGNTDASPSVTINSAIQGPLSNEYMVRQTRVTPLQSVATGQTTVINKPETQKKARGEAESTKSSNSLFHVMFHGHKLICLRSQHEAVLLLCQFQCECFPDKGLGSINNCIDRALRIKKRELHHPSKNKIINFLKMNGYNLEDVVETINVDDAKRVYHHMYGITKCSNATCVIELPHKSVDLDLCVSPSKKRTLTREIMMRVKKEKLSPEDKNYGTSRSASLPGKTPNNKSLPAETLKHSGSSPLKSQDPLRTRELSVYPINHSPQSDRTVMYGEDELETNGVLLVHASEDPHVIKWSEGEPKTGGLCNTIVGQLRSYRHKDENYLVVDDLCRLLGQAEFHEGIEKENIILYSCCQEIANFLNGINVDFLPLQSTQYSLVKEKDIGVHITDNNYLPVQDGLNSVDNLSRKRVVKQEIMDNCCSTSKRIKCEETQPKYNGEKDAMEADEIPVNSNQTGIVDESGTVVADSDQRMARTEEVTDFSRRDHIDDELMSPSAQKSFPHAEPPNGNHASAGDEQVVSNILNGYSEKKTTNTSHNCDKTSLENDVSQSQPNRRHSISNTSTKLTSDSNSSVIISETEDRSFPRPNSASTPESYKSCASQEIQQSPSVLNDPSHISSTPASVPSLDSIILDSTTKTKTASRPEHVQSERSSNSDPSDCELQTSTASWLEKSTSNTSSDGEHLYIDLEGAEDRAAKSHSVEKQITSVNSDAQEQTISDKEQRPTGLKFSQGTNREACVSPYDGNLRLRNMQLNTQKSKDVIVCAVHSQNNSSVVTHDDGMDITSHPKENDNLGTLSIQTNCSCTAQKEKDKQEQSFIDMSHGSENQGGEGHKIIRSDTLQSKDREALQKQSKIAHSGNGTTAKGTPDVTIVDSANLVGSVAQICESRLSVDSRLDKVHKNQNMASVSQLAKVARASSSLSLLSASQFSVSASSLPSVPSSVTRRRDSTPGAIASCEVPYSSELRLSVKLSEKRRSVDDSEVMNPSCAGSLVVPPIHASCTQQCLSKAYSRGCTQNTALLNMVHMLRKDLSTARADLSTARAEKEKAEKLTKHYEDVIQDILSSFKNGDEETPIVIELDDDDD